MQKMSLITDIKIENVFAAINAQRQYCKRIIMRVPVNEQ